MEPKPDILKRAADLARAGESFVLATVVRTVAATAAKAGAKAIIRADGTVTEGWIGGGCARGAVLKAAREALADGQPRFVSVRPEDMLAELGVSPGAEHEGIRFARNMCPSQGTTDIFIEPMLPAPELVVLGSSPVAVALAGLAPRFGFHVTVGAPEAEQAAFDHADVRIAGFALGAGNARTRYIVVSTQGKGDEAAFEAAATTPAAYRAFVGSHRKAGALIARLRDKGIAEEALTAVKAPAGLDIGAITPDEIALSILGEIVERRRRAQRAQAIATQS